MEQRDVWARRFVGAIPELARLTGGEDGFTASVAKERQDRTLRWRGRDLHIEAFGHDPTAPTIVFHHGYGAYSALYAPLLLLLAARGINVVAIDRPGHGLSEGRRGDCTVGELADVTRLVIQTHVAPSSRAVVLFGSSAGGMLTSCLIPHLDDLVDGYVCHGVHNPRHARSHLGRVLLGCAEAVPSARFPYRLIPRHIRRGISENPVVRTWFQPGSDPLASLDQSLRSVFSMTVAYQPPRPLSEVDRPVYVLIGAADKMLPESQTTRSLERMRLRNLHVEVVNGGHMLLHEQPERVLGAVTRATAALLG